MSKIEAGKLELSATEFSFREMLEQVTTVAGFGIEGKYQTFTIEVDEDVPVNIVADKQWLAQIIANLLSNANKFTQERGSIQLMVKCAGISEGICRLRVIVNDNGIGISRAQQKKLFSISRKYGGTGLGLFISKRVIEMMNGGIWIESDLGYGTSVVFEIEAKMT